MWTRLFWIDTSERVISTVAEVVLAYITLGVTGFFDIDWVHLGGLAGAAAIYALVKAIAGSKVGDDRSASLAPSVGTYKRVV